MVEVWLGVKGGEGQRWWLGSKEVGSKGWE